VSRGDRDAALRTIWSGGFADPPFDRGVGALGERVLPIWGILNGWNDRRNMLVLTAALASFIGFGLLAASYDQMMVGRPRPKLLNRVSARLGQAGGGASLLVCGGASVVEFGWAFGLVAWVGWLAVGALAGVTVLTLVASSRKPALPNGRRSRHPGSADFKPQ
jgi:hypothetical protein